jgi:hypothetical protein
MIRAQYFFNDRQGAEVEGLGLGVSALVLVYLREVVEAGSGIDLSVPQVLFCPGEYFFLKLHRLLIPALLDEGLRLLLPLLNLRWVGGTALSTGLGEDLMGTLEPLLVLEQGHWLNRFRLRSRSGTGKPRLLATALSLAGLRSHPRRLSSTQQKAGEDYAAPEPVLHY